MNSRSRPPARRIPIPSPEWDAIAADVKRAMRQTAKLNRLGFEDAAQIRALFGELTGQPVDETFKLIPPFHTECGRNIRIGRKVIINQGCTVYDMGGVEIADLVMIGPNVSLITASHPLDPAERRAFIEVRPIAIGRNVWIAAGATVLGGVSIGENAVVGAGAVVTRDVPPNTFVAGVPARVVRELGDEAGG
ncbi:transferase [Acidihalobacter aeolianus]|uniref:Nodulation protein L n=1 Tax=Acidihalobacter aeolianus TaxID=2792603 RepID=A0A1D8K4T9_9GAMM|nr:sugar O-acetyltransferase [Acidihalobacter aeolianus]AOV15977.1 transferase [Acidihalobacter aeolianus]